MTQKIANGIVSGMRCLPATVWYSGFPAASFMLLYPCCWPRSAFFPSSCHPSSSTTAFTWAYLVLLHWSIGSPVFHRLPGSPGTDQCVWSMGGPTPDAWDHLQVCALTVQPLLISLVRVWCLMPDMKSLRCGTFRFPMQLAWPGHLLYQGHTGQSTFQKKLRVVLKKSVESPRSEQHKWEHYSRMIWTMPGSLCLLLELVDLLLNGSTCSSGPSTCRLCRCLISGM